MSIENPPPAAPPAVPPGGADAPPGIPPAPEPAAAPSHGDWAGMAKAIRATQAQGAELVAMVARLTAGATPATPAAPAPKPTGSAVEAELAEMKSRLALDEVLDDLGIPLTRERRNMMRQLHAAQRPADVGSWATKLVEDAGWKVTAPAAVIPPVTPATPATPFNPGAPASAGSTKTPLDPAAVPQSVIDSWTPEQAKAWYEDAKRAAGQFEHPFKRAREAERVDGASAQAAKTIVAALSNLHK